MLHFDDSDDATWAAYALLLGKALSCARDSERPGDLLEAGAALCMLAAAHILKQGNNWPGFTIVLFKERLRPNTDTVLMPLSEGKPN